MGKNQTYTIEEFKKLPQPKFSHYRGLRSGIDSFTHLKLPDLLKLANEKGIYVSQGDYCDTKYAAIIRWVLRGLSPDEAKRKLEVDAEISQNAKNSFYKKNQ